MSAEPFRVREVDDLGADAIYLRNHQMLLVDAGLSRAARDEGIEGASPLVLPALSEFKMLVRTADADNVWIRTTITGPLFRRMTVQWHPLTGSKSQLAAVMNWQLMRQPRRRLWRRTLGSGGMVGPSGIPRISCRATKRAHRKHLEHAWDVPD